AYNGGYPYRCRGRIGRDAQASQDRQPLARMLGPVGPIRAPDPPRQASLRRLRPRAAPVRPGRLFARGAAAPLASGRTRRRLPRLLRPELSPMTLAEYAASVARMRQAQNAYFKNPNPRNLHIAREH